MPRFYSCVLALLLAANLLGSQSPSSASSATPPISSEPQLIRSQKEWPALGKCEKRRKEQARVQLDIREDGTPYEVQVSESSSHDAAELAMQTVLADLFKPAEQDGKPIAVHESVLVEMNACVDKVVGFDGKKKEQLWLDAAPRQTLRREFGDPIENPPVVRIGGHISAPVALNAPRAEYTAEAKKDRIQGEVMISLIVDAYGMPQNPRVVRPLPDGLNEVALEAVRKYRFRPAMKDGKTPVAVMVTIAVNFRLW